MFKNYFKIAIRNLLRNRFYSAINILGLAIGLTGFLLISLWVMDELSYDSHFKNADRIYRLANDLVTKGQSSPMAAAEPRIGDQLLKDYPEVENVTRIFRSPTLLFYKDKETFEENSFYADTTFFSVFDYEFVKGNPVNSFHNMDGVILTEKIAEKLFGSEDPMGKTVMLSNYKTKDTARARIVTGIVKNPTGKQHFNPEIWLPKFKQRETFEFMYVLFRKDYDPKRFPTHIWPTLFEHWKKDYAPDNQYLGLIYHSLKDIHLDSDVRYELEPNGNRTHVYIFSMVALFILVIAAINYMNLATARSFDRSREVGVRKVLGSSRGQLILQFLIESVCLSVLSLIIALAFIEILIPFFNKFTGKDISLGLLNPITIIYVLLLATGVGVVSGIYPAFFISSFMPVKALKGTTDTVKNKPGLRKGLVVTQFALSVIMIIATMVVSKQLNYVKSSDLGFNKDQILLVELADPYLKKKCEIIKTELLKNPSVIQVAGSNNIPGKPMNHIYFKFEQPTGLEPNLVNTMFVDHDYMQMMGFKLLQGELFSKEMIPALDSSIFVIANEEAVKFVGWTEQNAVGKIMHSSSLYKLRKGRCIGVVKDFHVASLHESIKPVVFSLGRKSFSWLSIKIRGNNIPKTVDAVKKLLGSMSQGYPFEYSFLDENFNKQYEEEEKRGTLFTCLAALCVFISCLGLMGLASFSTLQRTKEIGVRKISGATVTDIIVLLSKDFIVLVIIALGIALPVAWYLMNEWLQNFAYHTTIGWGIPALSCLVAIIIALVTISFHTIKAANRDLASVLKYE
ncbi:MAG: hypothetical protein K0S32_2254 [Bacteroidetes bacterium]|nr:hypothetical protein [Bacteroidota bacterium]